MHASSGSPLAASSAQASGSAGSASPQPPGRILLVTRDASHADEIRAPLEPRHEVEIAETGDAAIRSAIARPPDLVIVEVASPEEGALELPRRFRDAAGGDAPAILLVQGLDSREAGLDAIAAGADGVLAAPFTPREMLLAVESRLELRRVRREMEAALERAEQRVRNLMRHAPTFIYEIDFRGPRFTNVNDMMCEYIGYTREEMLALDPFDLLTEESKQVFRARIERWLKGEKPAANVEYKVVTKDGRKLDVILNTTFIMDENGVPVAATVIGHDISERRRAEEALRASEERFRSLAENIPAVLMRYDREMRVRYLSPQAERATGIPVEEFIGKTNREAGMPELLCDRWEDAIRKVFDTGRPSTMEFDFPAPGGLRTFILRLSPELGAGGAVEHVLGISTDISDRKQTEETLQESERRLRALNESLEQVVDERTAEVRRKADELRALATELGRAEQKERKRIASILHDHIQQLLVGARMQVSLLQGGQAETIPALALALESTLSEAIAASRSLAVDLYPPVLERSGLAAGISWLAARTEEKHRFHVRAQTDSAAEPASMELRALLFEAVRELLLNAVKHSGAHEGQVTMLRAGDGRTEIVVEDAGAGFDPSDVGPRGGGFGLFSIQQRLAHLGGEMRIESAPGRGTRVTLVAPFLAAPPRTA